MEKIRNSNTSYEVSEILYGVREPFNKNALWIYPTKNGVEMRVFNKGWKTLITSEDKGLSEISLKQVENLIENSQNSINERLKKYFSRFSSDSQIINQKYKQLEDKFSDLENDLEKLNKKIIKWKNIIQTKQD